MASPHFPSIPTQTLATKIIWGGVMSVFGVSWQVLTYLRVGFGLSKQWFWLYWWPSHLVVPSGEYGHKAPSNKGRPLRPSRIIGQSQSLTTPYQLKHTLNLEMYDTPKRWFWHNSTKPTRPVPKIVIKTVELYNKPY